MHAAAAGELQLADWISAGHDVYAIATQEAERSIARSMMFSAKPRWEAALKGLFGITLPCGHEDDEYVMLATQDVGAVHIALVLRRALLPSVSYVRTAAVHAGFIGGLLPNKGGAAIACNIGQDSYLFVSAHLAPHTKASQHRDWQFELIDRELHARLVEPTVCLPCVPRVACHTPGASASAAFDCVFWMGDLNYRVELAKEEAQRLTMPSADDVSRSGFATRADYDHAALQRLLAADQQKRPQSAPMRAGFSEMPISFWPTYKLDRKSGYARYKFQHRNRLKQTLRLPSFTDRVLYRSVESEAILPVTYDACTANALRVSDHRPVSATFLVQVSLPSMEQSVPSPMHSPSVWVGHRRHWLRCPGTVAEISQLLLRPRTNGDGVDGGLEPAAAAASSQEELGRC